MFASNIAFWERPARTLLGIGLAIYAVFMMPQPNVIVASIGVCVALTGLIGFCPACALAGRGKRKG